MSLWSAATIRELECCLRWPWFPQTYGRPLHSMKSSPPSALLADEPPSRSRGGLLDRSIGNLGRRTTHLRGKDHFILNGGWGPTARESMTECRLFIAFGPQGNASLSGHFADGNTEAPQTLRKGRHDGVKCFYSTPILNLRARSQNSNLEISQPHQEELSPGRQRTMPVSSFRRHPPR